MTAAAGGGAAAAMRLVDPAALSPNARYRWQTATIVPRPIAWITTLNEDGSTNLAPFSFFTGASANPPTCVVVVNSRQGEPKDTWRNIARTREYVINLVFSFLWPNVSWGGHVGGLVGGALCALVLSRFGRGHAAYSKLDAVGVAGLIAVGVLSVLVAYWRVRGYT